MAAHDLSHDPGALSAAAAALFAALDHAGDLPPLDGLLLCGEAGREALGTRVRFMLRLRNDQVVAVRYRAYGCPHTLAACEWLAKRLEGRVLPLSPGSPLEWAEALAVPSHKLGRLLVIEDALDAALSGPR